MTEWLLTPEEIGEANAKGLHSITKANVERWPVSKAIAQAQAKKIVEMLEIHGSFLHWGDHTDFEISLPEDAWRSLRKGVGLE